MYVKGRKFHFPTPKYFCAVVKIFLGVPHSNRTKRANDSKSDELNAIYTTVQISKQINSKMQVLIKKLCKKAVLEFMEQQSLQQPFTIPPIKVNSTKDPSSSRHIQNIYKRWYSANLRQTLATFQSIVIKHPKFRF